MTKVIDQLDKRTDSPWFERLLMPDQVGMANTERVARATSAMTSIRPIYNWCAEIAFPFLGLKTPDEQADLIANVLIAYWRAIRNLIPGAFADPQQFVIQKTPGLFSMHMMLKDYLLSALWRGRRDIDDEATYQEFLELSPEISSEAFWDKDQNRAAAYGSMKGFSDLADELKKSIDPSA